MKKTFEKLRELQNILLKEFAIEAELDEIPKELEALKWRYHKLDRSISEKEQGSEKNQNMIKELNRQKEELKRNKEKYESQMPLIKTQKEYEAITSEIAQIEEKLEQIEAQELEAYQEIENLNSGLEEMKAQREELKTQIDEKEKEVKKLIQEKQKVLNGYLKEKKKISTGLDEEVIYKFEKIVKNKEGIGIVAVRNNVCMGCNMLLPPQFVNDVRREKELIFCPNCSRILYYQEDSVKAGEIFIQ